VLSHIGWLLAAAIEAIPTDRLDHHVKRLVASHRGIVRHLAAD
jgi:hypothetical protein